MMSPMKPCAVCLILFLVSCVQSSRKCKDFDRKYSEIMSSPADTTKVIQFLNQYIGENPSCVDPYLVRGDLLMQLDNIRLAKADYARAISIDSNNVYALYKKGLVHSMEANEDSAIFFYNAALEKKKYKTTVIDYYNTPASRGGKGKYDIEYNQILYRMGESYYFKNDLEKALNYFSKCIYENFLPDQSYLYRATIYLAQKKNKEACDDINEALKHGNKKAIQYKAKYCE